MRIAVKIKLVIDRFVTKISTFIVTCIFVWYQKEHIDIRSKWFSSRKNTCFREKPTYLHSVQTYF